MKKLVNYYDNFFAFTTIQAWSIYAIFLRLYLGMIFLDSALSRLQNWDSQPYLFTHITPVPGIPGEVLAPLATFGELVLSVALLTGFLTRFAALGLLVMTMVIQFVTAQTTAGIENNIGNEVHYLWMLGFLALFCQGGGLVSLDYVAQRFLRRDKADTTKQKHTALETPTKPKNTP